MYDGYDICYNSEDIIKNREYNKNADIEYTSASVFYSHGEGYMLPWDKAVKMNINS